MKQCPTCNRTYADESLTYCLADGALLSASYDPEATQRIPLPRTTNPPPKSHLLPSLVLGVFACLVIGFIVFKVITSPFSLKEQIDMFTGRAGYMIATQNLIYQEQQITVHAGDIYQIPFTIQGNWRNVRIRGNFRVTRGDRVEAFVTDSNKRTLYQSVWPTYGDMDVPLSPGSYYLVFSNKSSVGSDVTVNGQIDFHYEAASYK